jgi:hypothetical protein
MRRLWFSLVGLMVPLRLTAQAPSPVPTPIPVPVTTITAGMGNSMGWFGFQAERYFAEGRASVFGALGYTPWIESAGFSGATFAAGLRGYTSGFKNRGLAEASVCQVGVVTDPDHPRGLYGPCLQFGYQFAARGGFTVAASAGWGMALGGVPPGERPVQLLIGLGLGYTWRRRK